MQTQTTKQGPARRLVTALLSWTTQHPVLSLALALAITGMLGYAASLLPLRTNMEDLFPDHTPHVVRGKEARRRLASASQILLVSTCPDGDANLRFITALHDKLLGEPLSDNIGFRRDISFFRKNALLFVTSEELTNLDQRLKRAIKKAVARDLGPFDEDDSAPEDEDEDEDEDDFDDGFDQEEEPADSAGPATAEDDDSFGMLDEEEIKKQYGVSSLSEYFATADKTVMAMKIYPSISPSEVDKSRKLLARVEELAAGLNPASYSPELKWAMEGDYHSKIQELDVIKSDLSRASLFALSIILVLIALYFARLRAVVLVFVPLLAGLTWTMGIAWLTVGYLNLITAFIFAIMFGLGVDFAVHAVNRYIEEREQGLPVAQAAVAGLSNLGRPMVAAAFTTTVTFLSLIIFDFRGFSQFGLIAGLGVPACLLVVYLFVPPLAVLMDRVWPEKPYTRRFSGATGSFFFSSRKRGAVVVGLVLAGALAFAPGIPQVRFESNMKKVMTKTHEDKRYEVTTQYRRRVSSRSASPIVLLTGSLEETRKVHDHLNRHRADFTTLQDYASIFDSIPAGQQEKLPIVAAMKQRLERKMGALKGPDRTNAEKALEFLSPEPFGVQDLPEWVKESFTDRDGHLGHFVLLFAHGNKADAQVVDQITAELDVVHVDGKDYHTTASYYILKDAYDIVRDEGPLAILAAALAVLLILISDFRSAREVVAAFLPLAVGVSCYIGYLGYAGENINMFNMVILPTVFGIGIDTSIHLLHRVREEGADAMPLIANTTGSAAGMSAATTAVGFGALYLATNPGLASIGKLAPVGIILCYLSSVLLTCSLSLLWKREQTPQTTHDSGG